MNTKMNEKDNGGFFVFLSILLFIFGLGFVSYEKSRGAYLNEVKNRIESMKTVIKEKSDSEIARKVATDSNFYDNEIYDVDIYAAKAKEFREMN